VHIALGGDWTTLLIVAVVVLVPSMLVAKLSTNAFPAQFPDAPADALATAKVGHVSRLALAVAAAAVCLADLVLLGGKGEALLCVLAGVPAVILWVVHAKVVSREEDGFVLASRVRPQGRLGKGIYRVPTP
jgi:hypothetical protein